MVCLILYDSSYMTFWNEQNYNDRKSVGACQRVGAGGRVAVTQLHSFVRIQEYTLKRVSLLSLCTYFNFSKNVKKKKQTRMYTGLKIVCIYVWVSSL